MKKLVKFLLGGFLCLFAVLAWLVPNHTEVFAADEEDSLLIHYFRPDRDYTKYNYVWVWEEGGDGVQYTFDQADDYGHYCVIPLSKFTKNGELTTKKIGFIVKATTWDKDKGSESDRFVKFEQLNKDTHGSYHLYLVSGDTKSYADPDGAVADGIYSFGYEKISGQYYLKGITNTACDSMILKKNGEDFKTNTSSDVEATATSFSYCVGAETPDVSDKYVLECHFKSGKVMSSSASISILYDTDSFIANYTYDGELGAIYTAASTTFRVWSPVSSSVKLRIYETGTPVELETAAHPGSDTYTEYDMATGPNGTWEKTVAGDLAGKYYTYVVTNATYTDAEVVDPYAKSCGVNGLRGMIVDFSQTNPTGWDSVSIHEIPATQLTVYETHVADLTSSNTWGGTAEYAKKFLGACEEGTTYTLGGTTVKTGFDHVKELGVNAVQLVPIFDAANNEVDVEFNWGYNPLNYNSLDGSFATDPYDGYVRIREFKQLVQAYNAAGMNIIMDVVYNHVASHGGSNFDVLMPGYYFRYKADGSASNGSGCGNETASDRAMFRKFMIDSTDFWCKEYKLGGFRFDLMGLHDIETMNQIATNLHTGVSSFITVYGEPWTGGTAELSDSVAAKQANLAKYGEYGQFNDKMRDALIKGGMNGATSKGWVTDTSKASANDVTNILNGVRGITGYTVKDPSKSVMYVTCHDNYTLYDRIYASGTTVRDNIKKMAILANSVVFTSQGISFMLAGEEFLRTKDGNHNSYNASYEVNELNYALKVQNLDVFETYQKLIALKQNSAVFGKTAAEIETDIVTSVNDTNTLISYKIHDTVNGKEYLIVHSNGVRANKFINASGYTLVLSTLGTDEAKVTSGEYAVGKYETLVLVRDYTTDEKFQENPIIYKEVTPEPDPEPTPDPTPEAEKTPNVAGIVTVSVVTAVAVLVAIYFIVGFTAYKNGALTGKFFDTIYKWLK